MKNIILELREKINEYINTKNSHGKNELRKEIDNIFIETLSNEIKDDNSHGDISG